jgi:glycosyltransferase involved in cell wall biosynthesis
MPLVSVIIPTYNRAYVVKRAIDSILNQTFPDFEIIVVDDGSTDDTKEVINSYIDNRIKYIYKQNGGPSSSRNLGLTYIKGKYVSFLDSDDEWPTNFLEVMTSKLEQNSNFGIAYSSTKVCNDEKDKMSIPFYKKRYVSGWISKELFKNSFVWPMAVMLKTEILKDFWFDEALRNSEDNDSFLRLSLKSQFLFVPDIIVSRYSSPDAHSKAVYVTGSCNRARSLERFYFRLGGDKVVPKRIAFRKIGDVYRRAAERHREGGYLRACRKLYKKAIYYNPFDSRLYIGLIKSFFVNAAKDKDPQWSMPEPLSAPLCHFKKNPAKGETL